MAKTLLVLGNGFDLACGLQSSFTQYIKSEYYSKYRERCHDIFDIVTYIGNMGNDSRDEVSSHLSMFDEVTFWDLFFSLPIIKNLDDAYNGIPWSDFEQRIHDIIVSVGNRRGLIKEIMDVNWADVNPSKDGKKNTYHMALQIYLHYKLRSLEDYWLDSKKLSIALHDELLEYEHRFGRYIEDQQKGNGEYKEKAKKLLKFLVPVGHDISYLNTFNYSNLYGIVPYDCNIWHVNGDTKQPIFGIDLPELSSGNLKSKGSSIDEKSYRFTKTYRRFELDEKDAYYPKNTDFARIIVFGHSLNKQDYSYFFALFNRLNFSNDRGKRNGYTVEFTYCAYGEKTANEAKHETIDKALAMLQMYNSEILHEENFRLMDILYSNGAIKFREIPAKAFE